ncbi:MAG TPA: hypothetical protein VGO36_02985 [Solirubrobacterales bacterium]|nr:hypothetical protein [Solirubrobacterales bacterium]
MTSRTVERIAEFLIPLSGVLAIGAAVHGNWIVFAAMVILFVGQVLKLRAIRGRREKTGAAPAESAQPGGPQKG